jgi:hypothetical protein
LRQWFVESSPDDYWTKQRGNRDAMLSTSTIGPALKPEAWRHIFGALELDVIQDPGDNTATDFPSQRLQLLGKGRHLQWGGLLTKELGNQLGSMRQRP